MAEQTRPQMSRLAGHYNTLGDVVPCACGGVRLAIGPVSLHFSAEEVPPLRDLVAVASELAAVVAPPRDGRRKGRRVRRPRPSTTLH